jgi:hypothetical protein
MFQDLTKGKNRPFHRSFSASLLRLFRLILYICLVVKRNLIFRVSRVLLYVKTKHLFPHLAAL